MNDPTVSLEKLLTDIGGVTVNGGYSGARIASTKTLNVNCGIEDFDRLVEEYQILFQLKWVDEKIITNNLLQGKSPLDNFPIDLMPETLQFTFEDFSASLKSDLSCILGTSQGYDLNLDLQLLDDILIQRLELRTQLFDNFKQDFNALI